MNDDLQYILISLTRGLLQIIGAVGFIYIATLVVKAAWLG